MVHIYNILQLYCFLFFYHEMLWYTIVCNCSVMAYMTSLLKEKQTHCKLQCLILICRIFFVSMIVITNS